MQVASASCRLWKKLRPDSAQLIEIAQSMMGHHGWWMKATLKEEFESGMARYMAKCATRVAGPWSEKEPPKQKTSDVLYVEKHLAQLPFVADLVSWLQGRICPRTIRWVCDELGNSRKSGALAYLEYHGLVEVLPFVDNHKDLLQFAHGFSQKRAYAVNIARGCAPKESAARKEFASFIAGLESLKDGFVFDTYGITQRRNAWRGYMFLCLQIASRFWILPPEIGG